MHAQAARIDRLRSAKMNVEESLRLYDQPVESVASLGQCLPAEALGATSDDAEATADSHMPLP
jgi:hypothetical protein